MELITENGVSQNIRIKPPHLSYHVNIGFTYNVSYDMIEIHALKIAFDSLAAYVLDTGDLGVIPLSDVTFIFTDNNTIAFSNEILITSVEKRYTTGVALHIAVVYAHFCKKLKLDTLQTAAVFLEELLHVAYCIHDETLVKQKVVSILSYTQPGIDFDAFYGSMPGKINFT